MDEQHQIDRQAADFMLDTSNQINYFIDRTHAILKAIEHEAATPDKEAARIIAAYCNIIECDLDDLSDLSDRVGEYYPV